MRHVFRSTGSVLLAISLAGCSDPSGPEPPAVGAVVVMAPQTELQVGGSVQLLATLVNHSGVVLSGGQVTWSTSDQAVATVAPSGLVSAVGGGSATITATSAGVAGSVVIRVIPPRCTPATVGTIAPGESRSAALSPADCLIDAPARGWRMDLAAITDVSFELESSDFEPVVYITDLHMNFAGWFASSPTRADGALILRPGSYLVWVTSRNGGFGNFRLAVEIGPRCVRPTGGLITLGDTRTGTITAADCRSEWGGGAHGWRLDLEERTRVQAELTSNDFPALITITDLELTVISQALSGVPGQTASLSVDLPPGSYLVWAGAAEQRVGRYSLSIATAPPYSCAAAPTSIALGQTRAGTIQTSDCVLPAGTYADPWSLTLGAATRVRIDHVSSDFDALLLLADARGEWIAMDDDGGDGLNSRLVITLPAGQYTIWATTFSRGATGGYQLSVTQVAESGSALAQARLISSPDIAQRLERPRTKVQPGSTR